MAVKIKFDSTHNAINPTFVLANRNGNKLGAIKAKDTRFADYLNSGSELFFYINKIENNQKCALWDKIEDFKLVWCKEWDTWFEIKVELDDENDTIKNITATSLGEAELSQIKLYGIQINTDDDIARDDYEKTVLYNESNPNASLLNRIMEKAPHYTIKYVADSIKNIQRTFTFDDISIYEAFQEISEEIDCIFIINSGTNSDGKIAREISVYDLESYCLDCKKRGEFGDTCSECGGTNIISGYGEDTTIFVSKENLADSITYSTDTDSVKNCFKLQAGDDLMTASLVNCNPNGTGYIWYISDQVRSDMSSELVTKLEDYDSTYEYYQKEHVTTISPESIVTNYNDLVDKYSEQADAIDVTLSKISSSITGYPTLMQAYYDTIDFELFLESGLMPSLASLVKTTAANEAGKLTSSALSPVAVQNINTCSVSTASSSVLAMAKIIVDSRYQVSVGDSSLSDGSETDTKTWTGNFVITNYSDEEDTATSETISVVINGDYEQFVKQKIDKTLSKSETDDLTATDIVSLFKLPLESEDSTATDTFENELKKYCLNYLEIFYDACHACMDVMIQQGVANDDLNEDLHSRIYLPYRNRLDVISNEISVRNDEIEIIVGKYDENGKLISDGMQSFISDTKESIQNELDFQKFLGDDLWLEFAAYRREDTYTNDNYISDGLNNAEIFQNALEFIEVAKKDIFKSATLQHSISASLKNLLTMKEFQRIVDYFEVGNWIRLKVDESVYRLRLVKYEISFSDLSKISVEFSDVKQVASGYSDIEDVIKQAASMSSSYNTTLRQAGQGKKSNDQINNWVNDGLALTKMKIIDNADNQNISWDSHGFTCKEYLPLTDTYDDRQLKIINRGLYTTDDNWITSKAGIGDFTFYNPKTGETENAYGVIADTVVSNLTLSKNVGIYNEDGSIELNNKGFTLTTNDVDSETKNVFTIQKEVKDTDGTATIVPLLYVNDNGELVLDGSIQVVSSSGDSSSLEDVSNKIEIGGRNLVLHSDTEVTFKNTYKLYELSEYGKKNVSGKKVVFSLDACSDIDGVTIDVYIRQIIDGTGSSCNEAVASIKNIGTTYKRYSIAFNVKESDYIMQAAVRCNGQSGDGYNADATISAKNIKVEIGDVATDWTLAPEDVDEDISQVEQSKNRVWYQTSAPSGTSHRVNDVWFDTDNNNAMYMWDGSSWVLKTFGTTAISDDAITTAKIYAGAVTASEIAAGAISTDHLQANTVTAEKIDVIDLFAQDITATGTISGAKLRGCTIDISTLNAGEDYDGQNPYVGLKSSDDSVQLVAHSSHSTAAVTVTGNAVDIDPGSGDITVANHSIAEYIAGLSYADPDDSSTIYGFSCCQKISPTDTNKWTAYKYSDGRLRCVVQYPVENVNISTSASGWYVTSSAVFKGSSNPYPVEFKSSTTPNVQFTFTTSNTAALTWVTSAGSTTNPPDCSLIRMASATGVYGYIHIVAEGYWK